MAGTDATEGQALWQPGGAEEDSRLREGNRHLHLAYDDEEEEAVSKVNFSIIHLVRTVSELTFSIIQTHYTRTTLFCLHLQKSQNTFSKNNAPCVLLSLMPTRPFLNGCCLVGVCFFGFVHSSSSSSVSCSHFSPTASNSNPPYRKMANLHKVSMQSRCSLV